MVGTAGYFWNAGTLTTGGNLVFQGRSDGELVAYNATTGKVVWTFDVGLGISAPPITYKIGGKQYLSLLVGFGGGYARGGFAHQLGWSYGRHTRRLITFSLDGNAEMPELPPPYFTPPIVDSNFVIDDALALKGANEYWKCFNCHGDGMFGGGMAPDLRGSPIPLEATAFALVVKDGIKNQMGMPAFPEITDAQLEALRHFIRKRAKETLPVYEDLISKSTVE